MLRRKGGIDMAWLAVDSDGRERIFGSAPERSIIYDDRMGMLGNPFGDFNFKREKLEWLAEEYPDDVITLPKGSIKKLIGKELSWNDEPVELK